MRQATATLSRSTTGAIAGTATAMADINSTATTMSIIAPISAITGPTTATTGPIAAIIGLMPAITGLMPATIGLMAIIRITGTGDRGVTGDRGDLQSVLGLGSASRASDSKVDTTLGIIRCSSL